MTIRFSALPTDITRALQSGGPDAYEHTAEHKQSNGAGTPCRHCLDNVPEGKGMLVLAHCPFPARQPYAETGPIFLCADPCKRYSGPDLPKIFANAPDYLLKGYGLDDRIIYGTGRVIPTNRIHAEAKDIFENLDVAYIHARSARNNCYLCRIDHA